MRDYISFNGRKYSPYDKLYWEYRSVKGTALSTIQEESKSYCSVSTEPIVFSQPNNNNPIVKVKLNSSEIQKTGRTKSDISIDTNSNNTNCQKEERNFRKSTKNIDKLKKINLDNNIDYIQSSISMKPPQQKFNNHIQNKYDKVLKLKIDEQKLSFNFNPVKKIPLQDIDKNNQMFLVSKVDVPFSQIKSIKLLHNIVGATSKALTKHHLDYIRNNQTLFK